jgi:hypothetical protein
VLLGISLSAAALPRWLALQDFRFSGGVGGGGGSLAVGFEEIHDLVLHEDPPVQTVRAVSLRGEEDQVVAGTRERERGSEREGRPGDRR